MFFLVMRVVFTTVVALYLATPVFGVELTLQADTMILNNGGDDIALGAGADQEDNFGGRPEVIGGNNNGNPRDMLFRFDPTPVAEQIADPTMVVSQAAMLFTQRAGRDQPVGTVTFEVYPLIPENSGWFEGTHQGSRAGWSGEPGSVSRAWRLTGENEEGDGAETWFSEQQFNLAGSRAHNPEADSDTIPELLGLGVFSSTDSLYAIELDPVGINELLPQWLADPEGNPGIVFTSPDATGQWFFESKEGDGGVIFDVVFEQVDIGLDCDFDGNEICNVIDLDALLYDGLVNQGTQFDLDGNGTVDLADRDRWLSDAGTENIGVGYLPGDTDLSGFVDAADLNNLGVSWQIADATGWQQGDFDGDGNVNASDLNALGVNWLQGQPPAAPVPEPSFGVLAALLLLMAVRASSGSFAQAFCET